MSDLYSNEFNQENSFEHYGTPFHLKETISPCRILLFYKIMAGEKGYGLSIFY